MTGRVVLCGNGCGHNHDSPNGPTGCCDKHGPYMYFCGDCHDAWAAANPERAAQIRRLAASAHPTTNGAHDEQD